MTTLAIETRKLTLPQIATAANREHGQVVDTARTTLKHAYKAGQYLKKAKLLVGHGNWMDWIEDNLEFSARTAQAYMQVVECWEKLEPQATADLTLQSALRLVGNQRPKNAQQHVTASLHHSDGDPVSPPTKYTLKHNKFASMDEDGERAHFDSVTPTPTPLKEQGSLLLRLTRFVNGLSVLANGIRSVEVTDVAQIKELLDDARSAIDQIEAAI